MPRTIEFNKDQVLSEACVVFWQLGYNKTSMRDLTRATGLNPGSIYNHFGSKKSFFLAVTDYYYQRLTAEINTQLVANEHADELLSGFFNKITLPSENNCRGCLLVNTLMECSSEPDIQAHIAAMFSGFEEMFYWILVSGQKQGAIRPGLNTRQEAKALVTTYYGLRVQGLTELAEADIKNLIAYELARLD